MTIIKYVCALLFYLHLLSTASMAASYETKQGEVLRIPMPSELSQTDIQVSCFGQSWPIYQQDGNNIAWIGVDLKTKPDTYTITWKNKTQSKKERLVISKGKFRVSHITVENKMANFDKKALQRIRADQQAIKTSYQTKVSQRPTWPAMIWPVKGIISTPFAAQRYVNDAPRSPHSGLDIAAAMGSPVVAPLAGTVLLVSDMYLNGNLVAIGHGDGLTTIYAHLHKTMVKTGDYVAQGQVFAEVGSTGRSTGPHLHWGVHFSGAKINPEAMLFKSGI